MTKRTRPSLPDAALALGLAAAAPGCTETMTAPSVGRRPVVTPEAPRPPRQEVPAARVCSDEALRRLREAAVDARSYARRVVYTWTTAEQAEELRAGSALLTRESSPTRGASAYDVFLANHADRGHPVAVALRRPRFRKARFGWATPWPTVRGWEGETYGDRLLRVVLRPEAWVARMSAMRGVTEARDLAGAEVPLANVEAHPERIGAVYFTQDAGPMAGSFMDLSQLAPRDLAHFREYVLPNESMVESWEFGTAAVEAELASSVATVDAVRAWVLSGCADAVPVRTHAVLDWAADGDGGSTLVAWRRALAIPNGRYAAPTLDNLDPLLAALRAAPRGGRGFLNARPSPRGRLHKPFGNP